MRDYQITLNHCSKFLQFKVYIRTSHLVRIVYLKALVRGYPITLNQNSFNSKSHAQALEYIIFSKCILFYIQSKVLFLQLCFWIMFFLRPLSTSVFVLFIFSMSPKLILGSSDKLRNFKCHWSFVLAVTKGQTPEILKSL